jgi:paraquat-inducible protein B
MSDNASPPVAAHAAMRRSRRIPIIWIIPILAVAIGAWLAWDTYSKKGPTITVSFESGEGLKPGQSQLKFKDMVLGTVQDMNLTADQSRVLVTVATVRQAARLFTDQTIFWVVKPRLFAGNLQGLDTLLSGSYIGMLPSPTPGKTEHTFVGHEDPPVLAASVPGSTFLVKADRIGSVSLGSPVSFRDLNVGEVLGWDLGDLAQNVTIRIFVRAPFDKYVNDDTRFWDASGVSLTFGAGGVQFKVDSLRAILLGGITFETALGDNKNTPSLPGQVFPLFPDRATAEAASYTRKVPVISYFSGPVGGLAAGSNVTMHGLVVGKVLNVRLAYDPGKDAVVAPVRYEVEPERIIGVGTKPIFGSTEQGAEQLLKHGLRATLQSSNFITGQQVVALEFDPNAPPAELTQQGTDFVLPSVEGGGLESLQTSATALLNSVSAIPFKQIGSDLEGILGSTNNTMSSPELKQALTDLYGTVAAAGNVVKHVDSGVGPTMKQLPDISAQLTKTLTTANKVMLSVDNGYGDNTKFNRDLERLLVQLSDAVRSIQSLTDMLGRHPEALIKGRPQGVSE